MGLSPLKLENEAKKSLVENKLMMGGQKVIAGTFFPQLRQHSNNFNTSYSDLEKPLQKNAIFDL